MNEEEKKPLLTDRNLSNAYSCDNERNSSSHEEEGLSLDTPLSNEGGLTVLKCAMFIVAQMAGSGILALPKALSDTGWIGLLVLPFMCLMALYCGVILGKCWVIVRKNHNIDGHVRDPYPLIGYYAAGKVGKYVVEICVILTLLGASVVFLLLSSEQISSLANVKLGSFNTSKTEFRMWILIIGAVLLPMTWFASPKEMWLIAYAASACTIVATVLIVTRICMYLGIHGVAPKSARDPVSVESFFTAFETIAFAFGGAAIFPSFQADMREPSKFPYAASLGFSGIFLLYAPVAILPYIGIGSNVEDNILTTMKNLDGNGKAIATAAEILITFHLLFAVVIINNPISQQLEHHLGTAHKFGWKRILIRTGVMILIIAIAETFPNFGPVLSFIGASTITMNSFILPTVFYLILQSPRVVPFYQKVLHVEIILIAIGCGVCGIYSAVQGFSNPFKSG